MMSQIINNRIILIYVFPFILGLITVFSFQPFNLIFINFFAISFLFLLLVHVNKKSKSTFRRKPYLKNLFLIGYLFGTGFFFSGTYWISYSLTFVEELKYLIPFAIILIPMILGLFYGFATLIAGPFLKNNFSSVLFFCSIFSLFDYLRGKIIIDFPWNLWAYSWSWFLEILQIINPIGLYAFNFLVLIFFCTPSVLFFKRYNKKYIVILIASILFFITYVAGSLALNKNKKIIKNIEKSNSVNIKIISPNFDLKYDLPKDEIDNLLRDLIKYSDPEKKKETIFIWPEGIFTGFSFSEIKKYKSLFNTSFDSKHVIIFGINTKDNISERTYNSLIAVNHNLEIIYKYDKKKLVPFGEFVPFENILNNLGLKKITYGHGSFSKGSTQDNFLYKKMNILPLICYEIIFPELSQKAPEETNLIINISEDAWFGGSIGPNQHFAKAIFRAIENNTPLARSANKGFSAFLSNKGEILKIMEPGESGNIEMEIPVLKKDFKNKNDLIFFILLFTYILIFIFIKKNND